MLLNPVLKQQLKPGRLIQVDHPQACPSGLIAVGWAYAALGGADLVFALEDFALRIELAMIREHQVGGLADEQVFVDLDSEFSQPFHFLNQADRVYYYAIPNHAE